MLWGAYVEAGALPKNLQNTPHKQPIMKKRQVCQHIDWLKIEDYCLKLQRKTVTQFNLLAISS